MLRGFVGGTWGSTRKHHGVRLRVRKIEGSAQDVADLVVQPRPGRRERRRGKVCPAPRGLFPTPRPEGVGPDGGQSAGKQAHGFSGERRVHGTGAGAHSASMQCAREFSPEATENSTGSDSAQR